MAGSRRAGLVSRVRVLLLLIGMLTLTFNIQLIKTQSIGIEIESSSTVIYVEPQNVTAYPGETFTVSVRIDDVTDLYALDIQFSWDPTVITYVSHSVRIPVEDYPDGILHSPVITLKNEVDESGLPSAEPGTLYWLACASWLEAPPFSGSGTVFTMTFNVTMAGACDLYFTHTELYKLGSEAIPHTIKHGYFESVPWEHDVSISLEAPHHILTGSSVYLNASVANVGLNDEENVNFSLFINSTVANSTSISVLEIDTSYSISHVWIPTLDGVYNVTAYAAPVPEETWVANNHKTDFVIVRMSVKNNDTGLYYATIQDAINAAGQGDTIIVGAEKYYENLVVNKTVLLIGENPETTIIDGSEMGNAVNITASNVDITNFTIQHATHGISVETTGKVVIENNIISNNSESGMRVVGQSNILIRENVIKWNKNGIATDSTGTHSGILIVNNTIMSNQENGIYLYSYSDNTGNIYDVTISSNKISSNGQNGICLSSYGSRSGADYSFGYAYIYNIAVLDNTIASNGRNGLCLYNSASGHGDADGFGSSSIYNVTFSSNVISWNSEDGIYLCGSGYGSGDYGSGYSLIHNVVFSSNTISSNLGNGVHLYNYGYGSASFYYASGSGSGQIYDITFSSNTVSSNGENAIQLYSYGSGSGGSSAYGYGYIYNITVLSNVLGSNKRNGVNLYSYGSGSSSNNGYGYGYIYNINVFYNKILSNGENGIYHYSYGRGYGRDWFAYGYGYIYNVTVSSNAIWSNKGNGVHLYSDGYAQGYTQYYSSYAGYIYNTTFVSNTVSSNEASGFYAVASDHYTELTHDLLFSENTISANNQTGIHIEKGINSNISRNSISYNTYGVLYSSTKNNLARNNDIYSNSLGMNVIDGATVNAEDNYWGDSSGPYHESLNVNGTGNSVNGDGVDLDFIPFLANPLGQINERPIPTFVVDKKSVITNEAVVFDASASTDDGQIEYYFFDFGDGTNTGWTASPMVTHQYTSHGVYNATLIVMDNLGVTSQDGNLAYVTITVFAPPVANFTYSPEFPLVNTTVDFNASTSYDPDGIVESYLWNFGDGNITIATDSTISHVYMAVGTYQVNLTITDNDGLTHSTVKTITAIEDSTPPTIGTPSRTPDGDVLPDQSVEISVNVTDPTSGVKNVTLSYTINDGETWTDLPMNHTASNLYKATIPPHDAGTTVRFRIVAYDHAGNNRTLDGTEPYCVYQVVPEFPPSLILPLFMMLTLLAVIFYRRKHQILQNHI